jgi:hypothetical protein
MNRFFRLALLILTVGTMMTGIASAANYYVAANGSDSNSGTSNTSPWLHAPGMPNCTGTCASTTIRAGDSVILRGGDTWHVGNSSASPYTGGTWHVSTSGSSGNLIYIGVDKTWYTGSSWARPIVTGDNPVFNGTSYPASCTYDYGAPSIKSLVSISSYNQFDNIEITGDCWSGSLGSGNPGMLNVPGNDTVTNIYCHGYTMTSTSVDTMGCLASSGPNNVIEYNVFDGSDAPHWASGNPNCTQVSNAPCSTGVAIYLAGQTVAFNVFHYIRVGAVLVDSEYVHDNTFEYMATSPTSTMQNAQHDDALMYYHGSTSASGVTEYLYNNVVRHNWLSQQFYLPVSGGSTAYIFNNVFYDNHNGTPSNCIQLNAQSSGTQTLMIYNNTFDNDTDSSSGDSNGCLIGMWGAEGGNAFGVPWNGPVYAANNHLIGYSNLSSLFVTRTAGGAAATYTVNDNGGEVIQATSTARSQGYTQSETPVGDSPISGCTSSTCSTVQAGQSEASSCSTFSSDNDLCSSTTRAASESTPGVLTFPTMPVNTRPSSAWDSGAYQLSGGQGTPNPPTGLQASVQ